MTIGFDIGSQNCKCGVTRPTVGSKRGGNMIDIVLDEASKRSVPPFVGYPDSERTFGLTAKKGFRSNINTTIIQPSRLLGCDMNSIPADYASCTPLVANPVLTESGVQTPCYKVNYQGNDILITPEHAQASLLKHQLKHVQELKVFSKECCITIPNNCSYAKREALLNAAEIAGVNCLKLISSSSAIALEYGLLGRKSNQEQSSATVFIDCGASGVNVGTVRYFKGGFDVVLLDTFEELSGNLMEDRVVDLFAKKFQAANGESFLGSLKSVAKIKTLIPKMLKQLVVDEQTSMHVDFLYKEIDFKLQLSREEVWGMIEKEAAKFEEFLSGFLQLSKEKIGKFEDCKFETVEIVGQVSRMIDLKALLARVVEKELSLKLSTTCNTDEAIVKGTVLQCAILSPKFGIRGGQVKDVCPYSVVISRQSLDFDDKTWSALESFDTLFPHLNELNKTKSIKFKKPRPLKLILAERNMRNETKLIGIANIDTNGHDELADGEEWAKFMVLVTMDHSGLLRLRCEITKQTTEMVDVKKQKEVEMTEEEYQEALAKAQEEAKKKAEAERQKKIEEAKKAAEAKAKKAAEAGGDAAAENQEEEVEPADIQMEDVEVPEVTVSRMKKITVTEQQEKKIFKKIEVPVVFTTHMQMTSAQMQAIKAQEKKLSDFDAECHRVQETRNNLETYVLDAQEHFAEGGEFFEYMTSEEADNFMNSLFELDDWLADDDFDQTSEVYTTKLDSVKNIGDIFEVRCREFARRGVALTSMKKTLNQVQSWVLEGSKEEAFSHIEDLTKEELEKKVAEASAWLDERQQLSAKTLKSQDPPFMASEVTSKMREINAAFLAVKAIPKPEPKKEEEVKDDASKEEDVEAKEDVQMEDASKEADAAKKEDVEMENAG